MTRMRESSVEVSLGELRLAADIVTPENAKAVVLFAHGSGSSRYSPRNQFVARVLNQAGMCTVLADLLTREEEIVDDRTAHLRFDIRSLADRVAAMTDWICRRSEFKSLGLGYFGASTGAAAALVAAAGLPDIVRAVVSRGGRPDLAGSDLNRVFAPVLLIVGSADSDVLELNRVATARFPQQTSCRLAIVEGASHLFEEPGALDLVAELARNWFIDHLLS